MSFVTFVLFLMNSLIDPGLYFFKDYLTRNQWKALRSKRQSSADQKSRREEALLEENMQNLQTQMSGAYSCTKQLSTNEFAMSFVTFVLFLMNSLTDPVYTSSKTT